MTVSSEPTSPRLDDKLILIVEDEPVVAFDMIDHIEAAGASTLGPITSAGEALRTIAGAHRIDAALVDAHLSGGSSRAILDALTERGIPFVLVTGDENFGLAYSPDAPCIPKPADMVKVIQVLHQLTGVAAI